MRQEEMYQEMNEENWIARQEELISGDMRLVGTKKEIQEQAKAWADEIADLEHGSENLHKRYASIQRIKEYVDTIQNTFKSAIADSMNDKNFDCHGMSFTRVDGKKSLNYSDDEVWSNLKEQLKEREELLKVARKSKELIFDSEGVEVPKVSEKHSACYITIKY